MKQYASPGVPGIRTVFNRGRKPRAPSGTAASAADPLIP